MTPVSRTDILPEQRITLDELRASIAADGDPQVIDGVAPLQEAIDQNDRTAVMMALRSLEARLETLKAVERHREKLRRAKLAVGYVTDDIDTAVSGTADLAKRTVVDPLVDVARSRIPGAAAAIDSVKPTTDAMRDAYAKLPTAMRLPILGAVVAGGSWLASFPVKWIGRLVGLVNKEAQDAMESFAEHMRDAGKVALIAGGVLGAARLLGDAHRQGAFDSTLDRLRSTPAASADAVAPPSEP